MDIAQANGAAGVIMYTDPAEYTGMKDGDYRVSPDTWWLPPDGVQRGTVFTGGGDPLTPGYPANGEMGERGGGGGDPLTSRYPANGEMREGWGQF